MKLKSACYKLFPVVITIVLFASCQKSEPEKKIVGDYSIAFGEFTTYDKADAFNSQLNLTGEIQPKIVKADQDHFLLIYGNFISSFEAGKKAFEFYSDSLINNYRIIKNNKEVADLFANVLFVGRHLERPSIYNYNLITKHSKLFWSRWGRKVLSINPSKNRNIVFITTALGYGQQGSFPYVREARLYMYSGEEDQINEIYEFGNSLQLYSYWENKDTFKVNITRPDSIKSEVMWQSIYSIDKSGKLDTVKERSFVLTRDGFPVPPVIKPELFSSKGSFQIKIVNEENRNYIYLRDIKNNSELMITEFNGKLKRTFWTEDEKYLFIVANLIESNVKGAKGELFVINTTEKKINRSFIGPEYNNLLVQGNLLFFDQQFEGISQITIYDFVRDKIFDEIRIPGGCGINDLFY